MQFPKTIRAAKAVSTDEKAMAAAIFEEIPPRSKGRTPKGTATIEDLLADLAIDLAAAGHPYSVDTLVEYRKVAAWAAGNGGPQPPIWLPVSWSVHREASREMTWAAFTKHVENGVKTVDDLRRVMNKKPTRKNKPSEKLQEAGELLEAGEASEKDQESLADKLSDEAILKTTRKRRKKAVEQQVIDGQEGMTDEQIEESERDLENLSVASQALQGAADDLSKDSLPERSAALRKLGEAEDKVVTALIYLKKHGVDHAEDDAFKEKAADIKRCVDLLLMERDGAQISQTDEDWLASQGIVF